MTAKPRASATAGFVMVAVLGVMVLLAGLLGAVTLLTRAGIDSARVAVDRLTADALARAGLELAGYQLFGLRQPPEVLTGQQIRLDGGTVTLFVTGEAGKADLNGSTPELLAAVYRAAGLTALSPEAFAGRVADWRDVDEEVGDNGAEAGDYEGAGSPIRPQNDAFRTVDDLRFVLGVGPRDFVALKPYLTVFNPVGTINVYDADRAMLAALPGVRAPVVERVLRLRRTRSEDSAAQITTALGDAQALIASDLGLAFRVRLEVVPTSAPRFVTEAVIIADGTGKAPYRVVDWLP